MPWEQGCAFSYCVKIELLLLTQVLQVTKKITNRWVKNAKNYENIKALVKLSCRWSTPPVNGYTIIPSTGTDRVERAVGKKFHEAVNLLIADCVN